MRLKLISCELFEQEVQAVAARSLNHVDIELLPNCANHLTARELRRSIQHRVNRSARGNYQAVLLACGDCQRQLTGLRARAVPLVLPRVHDCLSLLLERPRPELPRVRLFPKSSSEQNSSLSHTQSCTGGHISDTAQPSYWMTSPSESPSVNPSESAKPPHPKWQWRTQFGRASLSVKAPPKPLCPHRCGHGLNQTAAARLPKRTFAPRPASLLEFLVEGYWSYNDFLVVPPGWCIGQSKAGVLVAQESLS